MVVHCGGGIVVEKYMPEPALHLSYSGTGWDIGAYQYAARGLFEYDFMICMNTAAYFRRGGFIDYMVAVRRSSGDGFFGPMASYEHRPHIRTCCCAFTPRTFLEYPLAVDTRDKTFLAESGPDSLTRWYTKRRLPVIMVACDDCYPESMWRTPDNIFRRGDQGNCPIWDRHCDIYAAASPQEKLTLEALANGNHQNATFHRDTAAVQS